MNWLRSVRLVLTVLALVCCSAATPAVSDFWPESPAAAHHEHGHCPDSGPDGDPCESGCPCVCCHAQVQVSLPLDSGAAPVALAMRRHAAPPPVGLHPDDPVQGIFHPPRRLTPA